MERVSIKLEAKNNTYKEFEFLLEDFDYDIIFSKIIKEAKENGYLKDLYIYNYNNNEYVELLEWLEIDNSDYNGIDTLMDNYNFYYLDLDNDMENVYLIDIGRFDFKVKEENK
jgi:hypothetical protein